MKRLLAQAILVAGGAMVSSQLLALGLGELDLKSALNQPLKAEIQLVDSKGLTDWEIKPTLASQEDFERAGVDRPFFLTGIEFEVSNNRIVLSTKQPVNEPFLNFVLELNWPSGRVLREYTVLLDPPAFDEQNYQPLVVTPEISSSVVELAAPTRPVQVNHWDEPAAPGSYKVQPNDTLWAIALQTRPSRDITPQQMMLALQQENPEAFIGGNINRLKSHNVLNIPDENRIRALSNTQAIAEVARQNQSFTGVAQVDATGRNAKSDATSAAQTGGEVRLLSAATTAATTGGSSGDTLNGENQQALENDLAIALESVDKGQRENSELRSRLESLEDQIDTLQKLISLKDDELAGMQTGLAVEPTTNSDVDFNYANTQPQEAAVESIPLETEPSVAERDALVAANLKENERLARAAALLAEQQRQETTIIDDMLADPTIPAGIAGVLLLIILLVVRSLKKRKASVVAGSDSDANAEESVIFNDIDLNTGSLDDFNDFELDESPAKSSSQFVGLDDDFAAEHDMPAESADALSEADYCISFGKFDDAITALKDGIKQQPERVDLRLKLVEVYAEKDDAKGFASAEKELSKLGDASASSAARSFRELLSNPVVDVAEETPMVSFDSELADEFAEGLDFADALDLDDHSSDSVLDFDAAPKSKAVAKEEVPTLSLDDELSFDLDDSNDLSFNKPVDVPVVTEAVQDNSLDFDLMDFDSIESEAPIEIKKPESSTSNFESDLEFDLESLESLTDENSSAAVEENLEMLDFEEDEVKTNLADELDSLESLLDGDSSGAAESPDLAFELDSELSSAEPDADIVTDLADFSDDDLDFDLGGVAAETKQSSSIQSQSSDNDIDLDRLAAAEDEFDFLAGTDECATKLDLARAYIDMEDIEGARELLQEVVQEGSDEQKSQARELISNL